MSFLSIQSHDWAATPSEAVYPSLSFSYVAASIPIGGSIVLKQGGADSPGSDDWIIAARPLVSWSLHSYNSTTGCTLEIKITPLGGAFAGFADPGLVVWKSFPIFNGSRMNTMQGLYIPAWKCRFTLHNASAAAVTMVCGHIKIQGVT